MKHHMLLAAIVIFKILVIITAQSSDEDEICISCKCYSATIDCANSNLDRFPKFGSLADTTLNLIMTNNDMKTIIPFEPSSSISNISFAHNLIRSIQERAFEKLTNLTYLDLSHNLLTTDSIRPMVFKGPDEQSTVAVLHLKVLKLGKNILHTIHQDLFEFLPDLEELDLSSNPLKVLDHGALVALSSIHQIRVLDLSSTQLSRIPRGWLNAAKNLEILKLSSNNLQYIPTSLEEARCLRHLILDNNPFTVIKSCPNLTTLETLHINWMPKLTRILAHSLVTLPSLKELSIANNHYLTYISEDALVEPGSSLPGSKEGAVFPPLKKLDLSDNKLGYLKEELIERWDNLTELELDSNPWVCDCENQWMVSKLVKLMKDKNIGSPEELICGEPVEMKGQSMVELAMKEYEMRCLDIYGNQPDKDAKVLIVVLVVVLIAIPVSLLFLHLVKRPRGQSGYPTAYYRRAQSFESIY